MMQQTALALILAVLAGHAAAKTDPRPEPRPADMMATADLDLAVPAEALIADVSVAPPDDARPLSRPEHMTRGAAVKLADAGLAPPKDMRPAQRPRVEKLDDPFMMVASDGAPAPVGIAQETAAVPASAAPFAFTEAPTLPQSPLSVMVSPAPATGEEVLTIVSSASQPPAPSALRPRLRPETLAVVRQDTAPDQLITAGPMGKIVLLSSAGVRTPAPDVRPETRPGGLTLAVVQAPGAKTLILPLARSMRPEPRPAMKAVVREEPEAEVVQVAVVRPLPATEGIVGRKGSVCGDPGIKGQVIPPITSSVRGCGVADPVRITSVAGVKLNQAADIDCGTARALKSWVEQGLQPQFGNNPVVQMQVAGHYVCRPRNNIRGNKISEHGKGKAIDISGFVLASGEVLSIAGDWRTKGDGRLIRAAHKAACGIFNTTLGPGSDGHHEDHLHFDTASGRGPYCR